MSKIILEPSQIWGYFQDNKEELGTAMHEIASNSDFGVSIYVTEEKYFPKIVVHVDDIEFYSETTLSPGDCKVTAERIYGDYLTDKAFELLSDFKPDPEDTYTRFEIESEMEEREAELDDAMYSFLDVVCGDEPFYNYFIGSEVLADAKEHFLEYLARKWECPIKRPMYLEDENGEDFYTEYPYESMVFDDEDNPIYKR